MTRPVVDPDFLVGPKQNQYFMGQNYAGPPYITAGNVFSTALNRSRALCVWRQDIVECAGRLYQPRVDELSAKVVRSVGGTYYVSQDPACELIAGPFQWQLYDQTAGGGFSVESSTITQSAGWRFWREAYILAGVAGPRVIHATNDGAGFPIPPAAGGLVEQRTPAWRTDPLVMYSDIDATNEIGFWFVHWHYEEIHDHGG